MRVLLLRPNAPIQNSPPPLGLGYVAQALRENRNDAIRILDARLLRLSGKALARRIREFAPHVLGVSAGDFDRESALEAARAAKAAVPGVRVVFGGPLVSAHREGVLAWPEVDVGVVGEGEAVFPPSVRVGRKGLNQVRHNALLGHGLAAQAIRANAVGKSNVGLAENSAVCVPVIETEEHIKAARKAMREVNGHFLTTVLEGAYPESAACPGRRDQDVRVQRLGRVGAVDRDPGDPYGSRHPSRLCPQADRQADRRLPVWPRSI